MIKTASPASWRCTLPWCWPTTASETGAVAYIYDLRSYTCFETCWSPSRASDQRTRLPLATARGAGCPATQSERGRGFLSARRHAERRIGAAGGREFSARWL